MQGSLKASRLLIRYFLPRVDLKINIPLKIRGVKERLWGHNNSCSRPPRSSCLRQGHSHRGTDWWVRLISRFVLPLEWRWASLQWKREPLGSQRIETDLSACRGPPEVLQVPPGGTPRQRFSHSGGDPYEPAVVKPLERSCRGLISSPMGGGLTFD